MTIEEKLQHFYDTSVAEAQTEAENTLEAHMCFQCILSLCLGFRNGSVIEMLQFFFNCHAWSSPAYNFKPMASLTYPVIKSGLRPVPCLSGISMIKGVLWFSFTSSTIWGNSRPNFSVRRRIPISLLAIAFSRASFSSSRSWTTTPSTPASLIPVQVSMLSLIKNIFIIIIYR